MFVLHQVANHLAVWCNTKGNRPIGLDKAMTARRDLSEIFGIFREELLRITGKWYWLVIAFLTLMTVYTIADLHPLTNPWSNGLFGFVFGIVCYLGAVLFRAEKIWRIQKQGGVQR
jgi:hypothetical protein